MANATTEPRALQAALAAPAFNTRGGKLASRAADRHVERWAPETGAQRVRSLRSLGFVDRLVAPWLETAQRSASLRMFTSYTRGSVPERQGGDVSWVFPRPWYQDELDWMAAARQQGEVAQEPSSAAMFTTRGTYVTPTRSERAVVPSALYEFVAPSLSVASPSSRAIASESSRANDAYSPLVPLAAVAAAQLMARTIAPLQSPAATERPALRSMLAMMLQRAAVNAEVPTRLSNYAPELVTPPAPRPDVATSVEPAMTSPSATTSPSSTNLAERYATQRTQIVELQRIAEQSARRELAARVETARATETAPATEAAQAQADVRVQAEARQRAVEVGQAAERARLEERVSQRLAERRLHEQSRAAAAEHAQTLETAPPQARDQVSPPRVPAELSAAIASLPPELANYLGQRPERAAQAIAELNNVLRAAELLARTSAAGGSLEVTRGPRLVMPAGLGGLISTVDRAQLMPTQMAAQMMPAQSFAQRAASTPVRVPTLSWIQPTARTAAPSALSATASAAPAALSHVAWSDRWLARFTGASPRSLDVLKATSASPELRMQALAAAAPESVFVAPSFVPASGRAADEVVAAQSSAAPTAVQRYADDDETPDSVFEQIAASVATSRMSAPVTPTAAASRAETTVENEPERFTLADAVVRGAPSAPGAGLSAQLASSPFAPALKHLLPLPASTAFDVRALFGGGVSATFLAGLLAAESHEVDVASDAPAWARWTAGEQALAPTLGERMAPEFDATYVSPDAPPVAVNDDVAGDAPLTTLRTALLSWTADATAATTPTIATTQSAPVTHGTARAMVDAMTLPMLGQTAHEDVGASWAAPGMIADRAHGWSVAQERSASDLSLDFVTPELVLAARVYGLGPAEAAQAARLALAGPGQLTAMAGAVDRTFIQALAIDADRREARATATGTTPRTSISGSSGVAPSDAVPTAEAAFEPVRTPSSFGVERRAPRGAFLWPAASVGALGLSAAAPDGQQSMSVAALELLAAQAVAELGTYAALGEPTSLAKLGGGEVWSPIESRAAGSTATTDAASESATTETAGDSAGEAEVLSAAAALIPSARRARFDALYVALSQAPNARTWSPAARAARALALAGRGEDAAPSAYERAAAAWDVLPVVYASDGMTVTDTLEQATPELAMARAARGPGELLQVDGRPGLNVLSGRAGEALGSYVAPQLPQASSTMAFSSSPSSSFGASSSASSSMSSTSTDREVGAVLRAPTAAQELVRTGRPAGRHGGGEVEIPSWFEAAARKMLEDRSGNADGISLAELTLVTAAPTAHIAASARTASAGSIAPSAGAGAGGGGASGGEPIDVEKIADEVYRQILVMMDAARARNGEPYL